DHQGVSGNCSSCHNGSVATGKNAAHIQSSASCSDCHSVSAWKPVQRVDHTAVLGSCSGCHNGSVASGKSANHISSGNACDDCHNTTSWTGAVFDHQGVSGNCSSCHNGSVATGKSGGHFSTSLQCDQCHGSTSWTPIDFRHSSGDYPGDHRSSVGCRDCHTTNSQVMVWRNSAYKPDCAGCHANDYKQNEHKKVKSPRVLYSVSELRDCAGACHEYTDSSMTAISKRRSGKHQTSKGGF
ncbi:MAG: cytochrome C, partial [Candidatus Binatia bacterium]